MDEEKLELQLNREKLWPEKEEVVVLGCRWWFCGYMKNDLGELKVEVRKQKLKKELEKREK